MKTKTLLALSAILATIGAFAANRVVDLGGGKHVAIFDEPGSFQFIVPDTIIGEASVLVVGGGGGGGGTSGGGGGGGQVIHATGLVLVGGEAVSGTIGNGGTGGGNGTSGSNGEATTFATSASGLSYTAIGGGGGAGAWGSKSGNNGACGGGAGGNDPVAISGGKTTLTEGGYDGGARDDDSRNGAGGGGWMAVGQSTAEGRCGGVGYTTDISGESVMYAYGGGGGGWYSSNYPDRGKGGAGDGYGDGYTGDSYTGVSSPATPGRAGTGGGGGGSQPGGVTAGAAGGCGTVIIAYTMDINQLTVDFESSTRHGLAPYTATFTCTAEAGDLTGLSFTWDFGDGSEPVTTTDMTVSHTYLNWGSFTVSLTANTATLTKTKTEGDFVIVWSDTIYVDGDSANPVWPYASLETAATTLTNALSAVTYPGQTIRVAPGFYDTRWLTVTNAVKIIGTGADPTDTVLTNFIVSTEWSNSRTNWVLIVDNADALVANLAIDHGVVNTDKSGDFGSCLTIRSGTVSNCVVRGGYLNSMTGQISSPRSAGVVVHGQHSLLTHTVVTECKVGGVNVYGSTMSLGAGATVMGGGRVENCLFRDIDTPQGDVVTAVDGELVNVTIVDCKVNNWGRGGNSPVYEKCYGLCISNGTATARNVVVANVLARSVAADAGANRAIGASAEVLGSSFINCATDTEAPINATCVTGTKATFFKNGTYVPMSASPLFNAGVKVARFATGVDLAGNPRVVGPKIDIGCYECQTVPGLTIFVR